MVSTQQLGGAHGRLDDQLAGELRVEPIGGPGVGNRLNRQRQIGRRAAHHRSSGVELRVRQVDHAPKPLRASRAPPDQRVSPRRRAHPCGPRRRRSASPAATSASGKALRSVSNEVAPSSETTTFAALSSPAASPSLAGLTARHHDVGPLGQLPIRSASPPSSAASSPARPEPPSVKSNPSALPRIPRAIAAAIFPDPQNPTIIFESLVATVSGGRVPWEGTDPPLRHDWLKKPLSSSRAFSSAETSTLRGVSRKTFSAIRCMPPSSA